MTLPLPTAALLLVASKEVGTREVGPNNHGPRVEEYLRAGGAAPGDPWCMAFVTWAMQQAGIAGWPGGSYCPSIYTWALEHSCLHAIPQVGDVMLLMDAPGPQGCYHTGIVESVDGDWVHTIEGNTGAQSVDDGDGVWRRIRTVSQGMFVHWQAVLLPATKPPFPSTPIPGRFIEAWWHDGNGSLKIDGVLQPLSGVKIGHGEADAGPWEGGYIRIGLR